MLMEQNEKGRDTIWSVVMAVTTVLILLIGIFFLTKLFTANPLEGTWSDTENGMVLHIKSDGVMEITQALDRNTKRFAVHIKDEELEKAAEETKDLTEQDLRDIADVMEGTYEYSVDEQVLTLTEMEYGSQKTFVREED